MADEADETAPEVELIVEFIAPVISPDALDIALFILSISELAPAPRDFNASDVTLHVTFVIPPIAVFILLII